MNKKHGDIHYYLTQILTGHGCFLEYLHRFQLADSPFCPSCSNTVESAEHVGFYCRRFSEERAMLAKAFEHPPSHARFVQDMCSTITKWDAAKTFAATVVTRLNRIDWERKAQKRQQQLLLQQQQRPQQ
ncbi:uncharacterized protein LOC128857587 [Anastrepha ludens]|uniref:uncharacterized protein LOC128857587 n=1 Tax=Anastrepha ludens TaxID=28586 RepID=UPI0023B08EC6|nr:uncharacterized protein LOC128857587 [Anastrepha ludens]